jgi:electron transfer flavoprotein alpha subunit
MANVTIAGEMDGDSVSGLTLELITAGRELAGDNGTVEIVFYGDNVSVPEGLPVDGVRVIDHVALGQTDVGVYDAATGALQAITDAAPSDVILFGKSDSGSIIAARLAYRLDVPLAQDCVEVSLDGAGILRFKRPVFGGNAVGLYETFAPGLIVVVVRPGAFEAAANYGGSPKIELFDPAGAISCHGTRLIRTVLEETAGVRLEDADVVIAGGRGLGGPEPFRQIEELAGLVGGAVGASRAACDAGWIDHSHQVGLTGKTVTPSLYLIFGISGASQHMAGCSSSKNIVAVNTDEQANVFQESRFGVVGDWSKVLPAMITTLRELRPGNVDGSDAGM